MREAAGGATAALAAHLQPRSVPAVVAALLDGMAPSCAWQTKARADPARTLWHDQSAACCVPPLPRGRGRCVWLGLWFARLSLQAPAGLRSADSVPVGPAHLHAAPLLCLAPTVRLQWREAPVSR